MQSKILLVDDDAMSQWALGEAFSDAGYTVVAAATGERAAELMAENPDIGILVTDISLAGSVTGLQLARFWRSRSERPTIYITGHSARDAGIVSLDARDAFLQKPFGASDLVSAVERLLKSKPAAGERRQKRAEWREPRAS